MKLQAQPSVWRPLAVLSEGVCDRVFQEDPKLSSHARRGPNQKGLHLLTKASAQQEPWVNWEQLPLILTVDESLMTSPPWIKPAFLLFAVPPPSTYSHPFRLQELPQVHLLPEVFPKPPTRACILVPGISNDPGATLHDTHYSSNHGYLHSHTPQSL